MVIDREPTSPYIISVRDIDDGHKFELATICIYRIAQQFKNVKCFAPHCSLNNVRPFNGSVWDPRTQEVFGPRHTEKLYFAKVMSVTDQEVELNVIDTHSEDDTHFGDVLVAEKYAEHTCQVTLVR